MNSQSSSTWKLKVALRQLISDIEAMHEDVRVDEYADDDCDRRHFFGTFSQYLEWDDQGPSMVEAANGVTVYWPNLAISLEKAKKALEEVD